MTTRIKIILAIEILVGIAILIAGVLIFTKL